MLQLFSKTGKSVNLKDGKMQKERDTITRYRDETQIQGIGIVHRTGTIILYCTPGGLKN